MALGDIVQVKAVAGNAANPTLVFDSPATAGNTLVALAGYRSSPATLAVDDGTDTLTQLLYHQTLPDDTSWRRNASTQATIADGGETTLHAVWTPTQTCAFVIAEFEGAFTLNSPITSTGNSGQSSVNTVSSGTTGTSAAANSLALASLVVRNGLVNPATGGSWSNSFVQRVRSGTGGVNDVAVVLASRLVTGTTSTTATWSGANLGGASLAVIVLEPFAATDTTDPVMVAEHVATERVFDQAGDPTGDLLVVLDSSASTDDTGIVNRTWTETTGDGGTFDDDNSVSPTYTSGGDGPWNFQVEGVDAAANSGTDSVAVASPNTGGSGAPESSLSGVLIPAG